MRPNSWMRFGVVLTVVFLTGEAALAATRSRDTPSTDEVTFFEDVLPILQENC